MGINVLETQAPGQPADLLGKRIRRLRKARDRTLDSLAQQVGITKGYLSKVETGRQIPMPIGRDCRSTEAGDNRGDGRQSPRHHDPFCLELPRR